MLRTGRSRSKAGWSSDGMGVVGRRVQDLEEAPVFHNFHRSGRPRVDFLPRCMSTPKATLLIFMLLLFVTYLRGRSDQVASGVRTYWKIRQLQEEFDATSELGALSDRTWKPNGRPLQASSLANPPRIDRVKLLGRLAKLEASFRDEDLNEDIEVADDLRQIYGLSRWPPLISHVPSVSGLANEEYTAEIADQLLCSTTPCKLLLPVWTRSLSPDQQLVQIQQLVYLAKRLGRTLVLPNAGPAHDDSEELLSLGTCHQNPIARYFEVSKLLLNRFGEQHDSFPRPAVQIHTFFEWVKYRPIHPSAQIVVVESSPSNETDEGFSLIEGAEVRIDEHAGRGQGRHKNCLSSKASKLAFVDRFAFVISPQSIQSFSELEKGQVEREQAQSDLIYHDGVVSFLSGRSGTSNEAGSPTNAGSYSLNNPDVLVVEWNLRPDPDLFHAPEIAEGDGDMIFDYSPRLYLLAKSILSVVQKPLIIVRSQSAFPLSPNVLHIDADPLDPKSIESRLQELLRQLYPATPYDQADTEGDRMVNTIIDVDTGANDSLTVGTEDPVCEDSIVLGTIVLGTIWLGSDLPQKYSSMLLTTVQAEESDGACGPRFPIPPSLDRIADSIFDGFTLLNASMAFSRIGKISASLGKNGILEDKSTHAILERIIERGADHVVLIRS